MNCIIKKTITSMMALAIIGTTGFGICGVESGGSVFSDTSISASAAVNVGTPKFTKYSRSATSISLTWNKVSGASGYRIYRYNSSTKKWDNIKTISSGSTLTYTNTGLSAGTVYKYKVKAYKTVSGKTYWGSASSSYTTITSPKTITLQSVKYGTSEYSYQGNNRICTIKWTTTSSASGYQIYVYRKSDGKVAYHAVSGSSTNSITLSNTLQTTYTVKVRAYKTYNGTKYYGAWSNSITSTVS